MLPHLLKYTIFPHGFTFLEKLVFENNLELVEEASKV
jgi:hypothetical protein